jgi:quinoprotein glucose dehydrogenase
MSLDVKRGIVFLATGSPSYDYYGGGRIGQNLFGNSVVALQAETGKLVWYFQTVHHDLWDYDLPAPPNLVTINSNGKSIDAVAQVSKTGFVYVLDRETGKPIYPIEERPVPRSDIPGEQAWPTQPFATKPAPMSLHNITEKDLSNYNSVSHDSLVTVFRRLRYEGIFTPPSIQGTFTLPGSTGGAEWGGAAYDPETGVLYVKSNNSPEIAQLKQTNKLFQANLEKAGKTPYERGGEMYKVYCSACHGKDREGTHEFPALTDIGKKISEEAALNRIKYGGGKMPAFENILNDAGSEAAIVDFLYGKKDAHQPLTKSPEVSDKIHFKKNDLSDEWKKYRNISAYRQFTDMDGKPGIKPPWGILNAINLNTGEYEWTVPVGNIFKLNKDGSNPTGEVTMPGPSVTAGGLIFIGGTSDKKFRAYRKADGKLLWEYVLPGVGKANPSIYAINGKQYIAISFSPSEQYPAGGVAAFTLR